MCVLDFTILVLSAGFNCMCGLQTVLGQMSKMRMYCAAPVIIKGVSRIFRSLCCSLLISPSLTTVVSMNKKDQINRGLI